MNYEAINEYKSVGVQSGMTDATPHQMISMLLEGALDRIAAAKGAIERSETAQKAKLISSAVAIVESLRASLDHQQGGEIAGNLEALYDYMERRLVHANVSSDVAALDETARLLREIKSGWNDIANVAGNGV